MKETIVALSSPVGVSAIAVVRVSGAAVQDICKAVLPDFKPEHKVARRCKACSALAETIDDLIAIYFKAPNSYTGEDVLELFPHGNPFIVRKLIEEICKVPNTRLANRGEFTERAFLNGKMDLTQAEAVGDILNANNSKSLANAQRLLSGEVSKEIKELAESIKQFSAELELDVDFAEDLHGIENGDKIIENGEWRMENNKFLNLNSQLKKLKSRFKRNANEPPRVALFGAPNAGKSSLINALVKEDRLIVSEIPGTTRDFVEVPLHLPSGDILLIDTAGLADKAQNEIDKIAMQKTKNILQKANFKIFVVDASIPMPSEFNEWKLISDMIVYTHIDLMENGEWRMENNSQFSILNYQLKEIIAELDNKIFPKNEESEAAWITSERQIACICKAEECIEKVSTLLEQNAVELAAFEMREARNALCSITGEISDDNILDAIFSSYCIGK